MRLSIFIGLLYVAWCINPTTFDTINNNSNDIILICVVFLLALFGDIKELNSKK
jgi:hypothetical protein